MKHLFFILAISILSGFKINITSLNQPKISCVLTADKKEYKIGEIPRLSVKIHNNSNSDFYLIGSLDGSDIQWRFPHCYFQINTTKPNDAIVPRCGNMNTLRTKDFVLVKSDHSFNPYESIDNYGFFNDYHSADKEAFKKPGTYKIQFYYSTKSANIKDFMGDIPFNFSYSDSIKIDSLYKMVPKVELGSNEIVIKFVN